MSDDNKFKSPDITWDETSGFIVDELQKCGISDECRFAIINAMTEHIGDFKISHREALVPQTEEENVLMHTPEFRQYFFDVQVASFILAMHESPLSFGTASLEDIEERVQNPELMERLRKNPLIVYDEEEAKRFYEETQQSH